MQLEPLITISTFSFFYLILELIKRKTNISINITRKIAHIGSAIFSIFFYFFLSKVEFVLITSIFSIIFFISYKAKFLKSIHINDYRTLGEIFYPVSLVILGILFFNNKFIMITSIAIMGFADAISGLYNVKFNKNTLKGSLIFFLITFTIISTTYLIYFNDPIGTIILLKFLLISIIISSVEHYSNYGLDNLSVPILSAIILNIIF